ncbi:MAG TPA: c-type cytochrome [Burkholderiales bacterium]|nr:c-type cytochrome [Burkholderiales bacterium]
MSEHDKHSSFIKTPKQLIMTVLLAFILPVLGIVLILQYVLDTPRAPASAMTPEAIAERLAPVGRVEFTAAAPSATPSAAAAPAAAAPSGPPDGKHIYSTVCFACHATGAAGSPKFGDKAAWAPRIALGIDTLVKVAMSGKGAMPPKGGNPSLTEADIRAAVEYMTSHSK